MIDVVHLSSALQGGPKFWCARGIQIRERFAAKLCHLENTADNSDGGGDDDDHNHDETDNKN